MRESFGVFLEASLAAVRRDAPRCAAALAATLRPITIALSVDGEALLVAADREVEVRYMPSEPTRTREPSVHVTMTGRALLSLLEGTDELLPAILANRVRVRAAARDAERLFDALRCFVEGCARSGSAPALLSEFRSQVCSKPGGRCT